jgi:CheY-like chemotaxis protein
MELSALSRILFVEDDSDIQVVATLALESLGGFSVLACASGIEALSRFAEFSPDLVLLDVMMPGMDGPATLEALRRLPGGSTTPVVFMTARVQAHEVSRYKALGAVEVISKPFDPMRLAATVREIWSALP